MTRPYAEVIGDPIAHSKSPLIHNFWLAKLGIDAEYRKTHVRAAELADYFTRRREDAKWRGCNVTIPHKQAVVPHLDSLDARAEAVGAVNTIVAAGLVGFNTDVAGIIEPLAEVALAGREVAVIGAGGAARAAVAALQQLGAGEISLLNRTLGKAAELLRVAGANRRALPLDAPLDDVALVVNTSSLGMTGQAALALDLSRVADDCVVFDAVYAPLDTPLLIAARARGLRTIDGLHMLVGQAAAAFELFFGQPAPREHDAELRALLTA